MIATCAEWVTAVGTLLVATVAVWGEHLRKLLWRPKLVLEEPDERGHFTTAQDGHQVWYCHVQVRNTRAWCPARNCRVLLRAAHRRGPDGRFAPVPLWTPIQLQWSFPSYTPLTPTVVRHQRADLGVLDKEAEVFNPLPYFCPTYFNGKVAKGEAVRYIVEVEGENFVPKEQAVIEVAWDGKWTENPEEMRTHLTVVWNPGK